MKPSNSAQKYKRGTIEVARSIKCLPHSMETWVQIPGTGERSQAQWYTSITLMLGRAVQTQETPQSSLVSQPSQSVSSGLSKRPLSQNIWKKIPSVKLRPPYVVTHVHTNLRTHDYIDLYTHMFTQTCTHMITQTCTHTCTHKPAHIHTCTQANTHMLPIHKINW